MSGVLLLDNGWEAVKYISPRRAVSLYLSEKIVVLAEYEDKVFRSEHLTIKVPKIVALKVHVPIQGKLFTNKSVKKSLLKIRDNYTCQYCGKTKEELGEDNPLTIDHVIPISRFEGANREEKILKANTWENQVLACRQCNLYKNNRTPEEAGMALLSKPVRPDGIVLELIHRADEEQKQFIKIE